MRPNEYIASEDVVALSDAEFESLLSYNKFFGFRALRSTKERDKVYSKCALLLDCEGVLVWCHMNWLPDGKVRIPFEEVKRMAALGMLA